ncbi:cyclic lactone autoinducer peptide [Coprobacillus sp. TM10-10]|nr:cyclic lactone autoinducer peptide [Coprobacillus sp. TM10-10]
MEKIRKYFFKSFAFLISALAISTVNSACIIAFGQEKEPDSLKRFKKCDD